jgi:hypothetical protein
MHFVGGENKFIPSAINYYPRYSHKPDAEDYEDFCRVKMMLHYPHLELNDLRVIDGETVSWQEAYEHCQIFHAGLHEEDYLIDPEDPDALDQDAEEEFEDLDPETPGDDGPEDDFEAFSRHRPGFNLAETEDPDSLGDRDLDRLYDWPTSFDKYDFDDSWWTRSKAEFPCEKL